MKSVKTISTHLLILVVAVLMCAPTNALSGEDDISKIPSCTICGMDRHKFSHSRMLLNFEDGSAFGACSLHCAALEMAYHPGKVPAEIKVGDYNSRKLIDAEKAIWVTGGSKMGVMTKNAKWAFADKPAAEQFIAKHGGRIVTFEQALAMAYADMYEDTRMIREKRKKMKQMKKGKLHSHTDHKEMHDHGKHKSN